jgi:hypothetical protein
MVGRCHATPSSRTVADHGYIGQAVWWQAVPEGVTGCTGDGLGPARSLRRRSDRVESVRRKTSRMARVIKLGTKRPATRIGVGQVVADSDYPHGDRTWPHTGRVMERMPSSLPAEWICTITHENAAKLCRHPLPSTCLP